MLGTTNLLMVISPWSWLMDFMGLYHETNKHMMFRLALLLMVATHMVLSYSTEVCAIRYMFCCCVSSVLNGKIFELMTYSIIMLSTIFFFSSSSVWPTAEYWKSASSGLLARGSLKTSTSWSCRTWRQTPAGLPCLLPSKGCKVGRVARESERQSGYVHKL